MARRTVELIGNYMLQQQQQQHATGFCNCLTAGHREGGSKRNDDTQVN